MPRLGPDDDILELLLARFRSLLKPPTAVFTKQLPAGLERHDAIQAIRLQICSQCTALSPLFVI